MLTTEEQGSEWFSTCAQDRPKHTSAAESTTSVTKVTCNSWSVPECIGDQVEVAQVAGGLFEHVDGDPAQRHRPLAE